MIRVFVILGLLMSVGGCSPLWPVTSLGTFGIGYLVGSRNVQTETTREYYIDGVKVEDPAALGL